MRLRDIQQVLKRVEPDLVLVPADLGQGKFDMKGAGRAHAGLVALSEVPFFAREAEAALAHELFTADSSVLAAQDGSSLAGRLSTLRASVRLVLRFLDGSLPPSPDHYFAIRLPVTEGTTDEAARLVQQVHLAFDQPVRRLGFAPLHIKVDVGSWWLELAAATGPLGIVGGLLGLGIARYRAKQEQAKVAQEQARVQQEHARVVQEQAKAAQEQAKEAQETCKLEQERLRLELARLEVAQKAAEKRAEIARLECDLRIAEFAAGSSERHETESALGRAVEEISALCEQGADFSLQRDAPPEVRAAFPPEALPSPQQRARGLLGSPRSE